jgi:hypothetical protein
MTKSVGFLSMEDGLVVLTAGTAACGATVLYCGVGASDVFLILVGIFAFAVAGFAGSARWTSQRKLFRIAQMLHWACLLVFFLIGCLLCQALAGNLRWGYAYTGAVRPLMFALQDMMSAQSAKPEEPAKTTDVVWAMGGTVGGEQMKCVFPFNYNGATYHGCVSDVAPPKEAMQSREHPWCLTDETKDDWGYCLLGPSWEQAAPVDTVVHNRGGIPHRIIVLLFVVMCQLVLSSFSIGVLDSLDTEEAQERRFKDGWRGYGSMDPQGPPTYTPGYASTYAPPNTGLARSARVTSGSYASAVSPGSAAGPNAYAAESMFVPASR